MLTYIPISWHQDTYIYQEYLQNFIPDAKGQFLCAYAFWKTPPIQLINNVTVSLLVLVSIASWFIIPRIRKKKLKK